MKAKLIRLFRKIITPIRKELAFFLFTVMLTGYPIILDFIANLPLFGSIIRLSRYIGMNFFIAYLLTLIVHLFRSRIVKIVFYALLSTLALTDIFLRLAFGQQFSPTVILLLGETNHHESAEFINTFILGQHGIILLLILCCIISGIILLERRTESIVKSISKWHISIKIIGSLLFAYLLIAGGWKARIYYTLLSNPTRMELEEWATSNKSGACTDLITCAAYSFVGANSLCNDIKIAKQTSQKVCDTTARVEEDSTLTIVYVLGESFIKYHSSLYGYANNTNPRLKQEQNAGNLYVFNDVVTPYNRTSFTMKNTFSCNSQAANEHWADFPFFPTIFKQAGYKVFFWDIQKTYDEKEMYSISINSLLYDKKMKRLTYSELSSRQPFAYGGELVTDFFSKDRTPSGRNLVMFHLIGQHVDADKRYPHTAEFARFKPQDIRRNEDYITERMKQEIAHYDNATLYNDYVLSEIIHHYRNKNCILVYYSDHGEEIYDYRPSLGRKLTPMCANLLKYQFDIPFMIWCSDTYKQRHPEKIKQIASALNKPFTIDHAAHLMLSLGGIRTPYYRKQLDILSPDYNPGHRIVNDNIDYDKARWE